MEQEELIRQAQFIVSQIEGTVDEDTVHGLTEEMAKIVEPPGTHYPRSLQDTVLSLAFLVSGTMPEDEDAFEALLLAFTILVRKIRLKRQVSDE